MGTKEQRRQKRLERSDAKRKAARREAARRQQVGLAAKFASYARAPILHSRIRSSIWEGGIGYVLLSRKLPNGQVAFANFLVDVSCLGVKNVHVDVTSQSRYRDEYLPQLQSHERLRDVSPSYVRKLVEGAVEFARRLDLPPHREYRIGHALFGDIDPNECTEPFEFGREGKPFFVSGPFDTPRRCKEIVSILTKVCGPGNFNYLVHMSSDEFEASGLNLVDEEESDSDALEVEEVDGERA